MLAPLIVVIVQAIVVLPHWRGPTKATTRLRFRAADVRLSKSWRSIMALHHHEIPIFTVGISWLIVA
jgi:hypothetical protein